MASVMVATDITRLHYVPHYQNLVHSVFLDAQLAQIVSLVKSSSSLSNVASN